MKKRHLTTNQGVPVTDNQNSLTVGERGPVLLQDVQLTGNAFPKGLSTPKGLEHMATFRFTRA